MTQADNCGSTPAALNSVQDLSVVTGACGLTGSVDSTGSSTLAPNSRVDSVNGGAVRTSTAGSQASGTSSQDRARPTSGSSRNSWSTMGLVWSLAVVVMLHGFT
jgi:hypothetical protein